MKLALSKIWLYATNHKIKTAITVIIFGSVAYYTGIKVFGTSTTAPKYITANVTKSTIVSSIIGTGQVSASNLVDLKAKVSGDITYIGVQAGQEIKAGTIVAKLDARDAEINLESAQLSYDKLTKSADPKNVADDQASIDKAYTDGWNTVATVFTNFPSIANSENDLFNTKAGFLSDTSNYNDRNTIADSYTQKANMSYNNANDKYQTVLTEYNSLSAHSSTTEINKILSDTYDMTKLMSTAIKDTQAAITYIATIESTKNTSAETTAATNVNSLSDTVNGYLSNIISAENNIKSSENTLATLLQGADALDVKSSALTIEQKQKALSDYYVRAPFDAVVASVPGKVGDSAGTETIATLITKGRYADISLNEVDAAKVTVGQKATITFDAIDGLSIAGEVAEINPVGTVSQGVVTYSIKIGFDTNDDRIKPGMSVSVAVVTNVATDVLTVPASAIKTQGGQNYVEMFDTPLPIDTTNTGIMTTQTPRQIPVETGISNDTSTEIKSGLKEGDQIITKTITSTTKTTTTSAPSLFSAAGAGRGVGGASARVVGTGR